MSFVSVSCRHSPPPQAIDWNDPAIKFYKERLKARERIEPTEDGKGAKWLNFIMGLLAQPACCFNCTRALPTAPPPHSQLSHSPVPGVPEIDAFVKSFDIQGS